MVREGERRAASTVSEQVEIYLDVCGKVESSKHLSIQTSLLMEPAAKKLSKFLRRKVHDAIAR